MTLLSSFPFLTILVAYRGVILCTSKQGTAYKYLCLGWKSVCGCARCVGTPCYSRPDVTEQLLLLQQTVMANCSCVRVQSCVQRSTPASAVPGNLPSAEVGRGAVQLAWARGCHGASGQGPPCAFRGCVRARLTGQHKSRHIQRCEAMLPGKQLGFVLAQTVVIAQSVSLKRQQNRNDPVRP